MGMIVKSLMAGVVLAGMAGSGVYFGLSPVEDTTVTAQRIKPIAPKTVTVKKMAESKAHPHTDRKPDTKKKEESSPQKKWIDQYVDKSVKQYEPDNTVDLETQEVMKTDLDKEKATKAAKAKADKMKAEMREARQKAQADAKGKFVVQDDKPSSAIGTMESFDTIGIIMREAKQIESTDLRDRAYLNVVDYALMHGYFGEAKTALTEISQPELRETARSRIAVRYAGTGNPGAAFDLVDGVEMTDFKDAMRIQIIEALIAAESLPAHEH